MVNDNEDPNDVSTLDKMNVRRLVIYLKEELSDVIKQSLFVMTGPTKEIIRENTMNALNGFKENKSINDYAVVCDESNQPNWRSLYPGFWSRARACLAYNMFGSSIEEKDFKWYHHLFPYERNIDIQHGNEYYDSAAIKMQQIVQEVKNFNNISEDTEDYEEIQIDYYRYITDIINNDFRTSVTYKLKNPNDLLYVDVFIKPTVPVELIKLSAVVTKNGATFTET